MSKEPFEDVKGTWAYELKKHWDAFCDHCWKGFNRCCEDMRENGHENKVDRFKWREYVLWDMQRRHKKEMNESRKISK